MCNLSKESQNNEMAFSINIFLNKLSNISDNYDFFFFFLNQFKYWRWVDYWQFNLHYFIESMCVKLSTQLTFWLAFPPSILKGYTIFFNVHPSKLLLLLHLVFESGFQQQIQLDVCHIWIVSIILVLLA